MTSAARGQGTLRILENLATPAGLRLPDARPVPRADVRARLAQNPFLMAPMAGVTDGAYRLMARAGGASLAYTEMVSVAGIHFGGQKTWDLVLPAEGEPDVAVQLFGSKPEQFREAALEEVRDELPHSITVSVVEMGLREDRDGRRPLLDIHADLVVERDSQKGIMVGRGGERVKRIGTRARRQISSLLGTPVRLDLRVKVVKDWQRDAKQLNRLGF